MKKDIRNAQTIFVRELLAYFNSPIAYIFIVVFVLISCGMFMTHFFLIGNADMRYFFSLLPILLCVFLPAISMRLWSEDKRGNTFEMLLTFPMKTSWLVFGKFCASLAFYAIALGSTLLVPIMLSMVGNPDLGPIVGGYVGALFLGSFFLSFGIFVSGLCKDQIVSFIVAMIGCFFLYLCGMEYMASIVDGWLPGIGTFLRDNFGFVRHYASFEKGVIDVKDIIYFALMTVIFLCLNVFSLEDRLRPKAKVLFSGAVVISIAISLIVNWLIGDIQLGRFDLTEAKVYTVTESTKDILKGLKSPVTVKLYISAPEKMPTAFKTLEQEIKDKLEEFKISSAGKLNYSVIHMEVAGVEEMQTPTSEEQSPEEKLQEKGITPFQVQSIEEDEMGIRVIYSAISIAYKEKDEEIIPRVVPQNIDTLEYDLISKIYRMTLPKTPKIALIAPYEERATDPQMMMLLKQLGQALPAQYRDDKYRMLEGVLQYEGYDIARVRLTQDEPIPDDADTLVIIDPENFNERQKYEIDQFLHAGGNVIIAAQGFRYDYNTDGRSGVEIMPRQVTHGLNDMLTTYGVTLSEEMLMDDQFEMISISSNQSRGPFSMQVPVKVPMQIRLRDDSLNRDVSITSRLDSLFYVWGSSLVLDSKKIESSSLKKTLLLTSGKTTWTVPFVGGQLMKADVAKHKKDAVSYVPLAVLLEGQFESAFKGEEKPAWPDTDGAEDDAEMEVPEHGSLIVIGCASMFEESFVQGGGMMNFFSNCVDSVTLGETLIGIRSHKTISRQIKPLHKMQKIWYRCMTIFLVPFCVVIIGIARALIRRKEKELYVKRLDVKTE